MHKEWIGNKRAMTAFLGARRQEGIERAAGDFYATDPRAVDALGYVGKLPKSNRIWECAAGQGDLSKALVSCGYEVICTDLYDRGYCKSGVDFLQTKELLAPCIFTNPPYIYGTEFCVHAINLGAEEVYMFMKLQFLEGKRRYRELYSKNPPTEILQFVDRIGATRNGDSSLYRKASAIPFCWIIWRKGNTKMPQLSWISVDNSLIHNDAA